MVEPNGGLEAMVKIRRANNVEKKWEKKMRRQELERLEQEEREEAEAKRRKKEEDEEAARRNVPQFVPSPNAVLDPKAYFAEFSLFQKQQQAAASHRQGINARRAAGRPQQAGPLQYQPPRQPVASGTALAGAVGGGVRLSGAAARPPVAAGAPRGSAGPVSGMGLLGGYESD
ncbi:unnamed protein product [Prorocentrum cordatum]|uniref:Ribosome biogenesis protein NOP53 n=1 Tax=Prorocentrum cordatum TaxID=2364126 RepID=A0ABN9W5D9_9DINO|nr:unnamed protein product [Polarella glacialis]